MSLVIGGILCLKGPTNGLFIDTIIIVRNPILFCNIGIILSDAYNIINSVNIVISECALCGTSPNPRISWWCTMYMGNSQVVFR